MQTKGRGRRGQAGGIGDPKTTDLPAENGEVENQSSASQVEKKEAESDEPCSMLSEVPASLVRSRGMFFINYFINLSFFSHSRTIFKRWREILPDPIFKS